METLEQKSIEQYFAEHNITDPDLKAKILPEITGIIYDRNLYVVQAEKEDDQYKKQQMINDVQESDKTIKEIFENFLKEQKA